MYVDGKDTDTDTLSGQSIYSSFQQISQHTCRTCKGKGCLIVNKPCEVCNSTSYVMSKEIINFTLIQGISAENKIVLERYGHQHKDGRSSNLNFHLIYEMPPHWILDIDTGDLKYSMNVSLPEYLNGWTGDIITPFNETLTVSSYYIIYVNTNKLFIDTILYIIYIKFFSY